MAKRKKTIITSNKEIYDGLLMLKIKPEVILKKTNPKHIDRIINNVNKKNKIIDKKIIGKMIILKKINDINYEVYLGK